MATTIYHAEDLNTSFPKGRDKLTLLTTIRHLANKHLSMPDAASHDYRNVFSKERQLVSSLHGRDFTDARVLVIGCGYNYSDLLLWSSSSEYAVGIDVRRSFWKSGWGRLLEDYREQEYDIASACIRALIRRGPYIGYYERLRKVSQLNLDEMNQDLITYDGKDLPFADESFDIILSNAVLEHVSDLGALSSEMARVTKDCGICYHLWHNYYSLFGAHVPEDIALANPWGHLRNDDRVREWLALSGTYLNRALPGDIVHALSQNFQEDALYRLDKNHNVFGIDGSYEGEGEHLLSEEIRNALGAYPESLLLTRAYAFLGRKKRTSAATE